MKFQHQERNLYFLCAKLSLSQITDLTLVVSLLLMPVGTSEQPIKEAWHFLHRLQTIKEFKANKDVNGLDQCCQKCKVQLTVYRYQASLLAVGDSLCNMSNHHKPFQQMSYSAGETPGSREQSALHDVQG